MIVELVLGNMDIIYKSKHKGLLGVVESWYTCVDIAGIVDVIHSSWGWSLSGMLIVEENWDLLSLMSFIQAGGDPGQEC